MYNFITNHNKVYLHIRSKLLKSLEKTVKLNSKVNLLGSCNKQEERVMDQEMSVDSVEPKKMRVAIDTSKRDEKMMHYFGKVDGNMPRFFSK